MTPTFFVLGAAKCGTTALQYYLGQHPDVFVSRPEETRFFDFLFDRGMDYYQRTFFSEARGERAVGEATPHYLALPFVGERIRDTCPDSRHIVMVRDPAERAFSHWWMEWTAGRETLPFEEAIARATEEIEQGLSFDGPDGEPRWRNFMEAYVGECRVLSRAGYLSQGFYADQVSHYQRLFGEDRVRVVFLPDLAKDPGEVVRGLWEFLGVDPGFPLPDSGPVNQATTRAGRRLERLLGGTGLQHYLPVRVRVGVKRMLARIGKKGALGARARSDLARYYAPHNARLAEMTGRDLSSWDVA